MNNKILLTSVAVVVALALVISPLVLGDDVMAKKKLISNTRNSNASDKFSISTMRGRNA